jgi:hypothetical protein
MQSALREMTRAMRGSMLFVAALVLALSMPSTAPAVQAAMSVEVPAGQHRSLRLRNLIKDVVLEVAVQATDKLAVSLVSELDYRRYPKPEDPVFVGIVDKRLSFTVTIPQSGHYFLVFDNRQGSAAQKVKFVVRAEQPARPPPTPAVPPPQNGKRDKV